MINQRAMLSIENMGTKLSCKFITIIMQRSECFKTLCQIIFFFMFLNKNYVNTNREKLTT